MVQDATLQIQATVSQKINPGAKPGLGRLDGLPQEHQPLECATDWSLTHD